MAEQLTDRIIYPGSYVDDIMSIDTFEALSTLPRGQKFVGLTVTVKEGVTTENGDFIPVDVWLSESKNGWVIKNIAPIDNLDCLNVIPNEYMYIGFKVALKNGENYILSEIAEGQYSWERELSRTEFDSTVADVVDTAVNEAIAKVTSGATEAFDTLQEIEAWINENSGKTADLTGYVKQEDLEGYVKTEELPSMEEYATKDYVDGKVGEIVIPSLDGYATEAWVTEQGFITEHQDITGKQDVIEDLEAIREGAAKGATALQEVPEGYATEAWVGEQGFLTEHQDISGLATKEEVSEAIASIEIPSVEGLATESWVSAEIAKAQLEGEDVDLSGYATKDDIKGFATKEETEAIKTWVGEQGFITEHQSLEGLATEQFVTDRISEIQIPETDHLATKDEVAKAVEGLATEEFVTNQGYITEHQDISHLATKEEVNEIVKQIPSIDGLATETYVDEKVASINIPSIEGLATEAWVNEQGFLTEHQDITGKQDVIEDLEVIREGAAKGATALQEVPEGYATEAWVGEQGFLTEHQDLSEYAKKEELPTLEGYATESWVSAEIAKAQLEGEDVDLSGYATKDDIKDFATEQFVTDRISEIQIPSVEGLATEVWVNEQGFLTEHQDITGKQDVIEDLEDIREGAAKGATALQEVPEGYATEAWVNEQGFLTEHQDITGKQDVIDDLETIREGASKGATALQEVPEGYATEAWVGEQGFLTEHQDISGLATKEDVANAIAEIEIPSIEGLASEQFVADEIAKIEIPSIDHLATKEELEIVSGSIKSVIEDLLIPENAKETLDTLEEISAWIQSHPDDAASMNAQIVALQESAHTHENKDVLDGITAEKVAAWDAAEANAKGYANDEIAKLSDVYAKKTDIEGLATETWVSAEIAKAQLEGEDIDLSGYATKDDIKDFATEQFVTDEIAKIEIPTLDGYATEAWVGEQGFLTEHQDITGKQDVIEDLEVIREGASKGATALQEVPEGYATEAWVGEQGFLTEHQDISGLATKEEVSEAVLSAQTYADSLVENLKPYDGGTAVDVVDYTVNVNVAEDGFLKVNEENELTVTGVTLDAAVTSKDITIEGGQWATAVKTVFTGGTVPAGTTWQSFLESMLCVEKFDTSYSMSKAFTVSCGTLGEGITGATNNSSVEVGTKVSLKSFEANPTTASQSYTVSTFDYGYKLGEDGTYNKGTSFKETLTPSLKASNDALTATFTTFVDESGNTIAKISGNTSMGEVKMRVMDGTNKVVIAQTGDTYTASSAVTAGTIYVATNLKNYYKSDKKTPNTYTPSYASEDKTATASTTYTVTGYRNTFYGTTSKTDAADATFIRTLTKSNKAIAAGNTISFDTNSSDGHLRMVIASPRTIKSVKNQTGTQDLTALLVGTKATVSVGGVDNFAPISYNVYDYTWKGAFGNETWIITFA